jgi:DNA-binding LacI/PurR family transcriptional regulator
MANVKSILQGRTHHPVRRTKLQQTCGQIADLAHTLGPDAKLPTVVQLRDKFGVSVATLNSALTELEAQRVIRRKHGVGIYVSRQIRQRTVCLICDPSFFRVSGASPFWNLLVDQVRQRAEAEREAFSFHFTADDPGAALNDEATSAPLQNGLVTDITNGRVDGILCVGVLKPTMDWLARQHVPVVAFAAPGPYTVGIKTEEVMRLGVPALVAKGCRRIGYWSPVSPYRVNENPLPLSTDQTRFFEESVTAAGLVPDPVLIHRNADLVIPGEYHTLSHQEQGFNMVTEIFGPESDPAKRPDGIVSSDDMLTQGALTAFQRLNIGVGEEIHIATHANVGSSVLLGWEDALTIIEVDPGEIVNEMFFKLERLMDGITPVQNDHRVLPRLRVT